MIPRRLNVARAGGLLFGVEVVGAVVAFASTVYFASALGATLLGVFFLFEALLSTVATVADFGLRGAVEKRISEGREAAELLAAALLLKLAFLGALAAVVLAAREPIAAYVGADVAPLLVVAAVLYEFSVLTVHVLRGELRTEETAALYLLRLLTYVTVAVALVRLGYGAEALIYGLIVSYAVMCLVGVSRISVGLARPSIDHFRSLIAFAKFNGIWALGGYVYNTMDLLVVGFFLSQAHVAGYELAWRVTVMVGLVGGVVSETLFAQLSAWRSAGEEERIRRALRDGLTASLFLVIPAFFGALVLAPEILGFVFGPEFAIAAGALAVLMGEKVVAGVNNVFDAAIRAFDRPDVGAYATVGSLLLNVALNVALVPRFGLVGAAAATTIAMVANTVVLWWALGRLTTLSVPVPELGACLGAAVAMAVVLVGLETLLPVTTTVALFAHIGVGGAVYLLAVLASPTLRGKALTVGTRFIG
ncbi:polysaccharide biosynthesis C-terminal domain-containing protein [Saliphagus sp. LR7]|uniref:oligosaccharide flippase family protein n=1 Tax=Saliphagus sp. LR7 TaxID=2282654 RepID=UPI000DF77318|nr:polysaccharide biosynthesis C-terminal domain-containing protein [Saliphagus sp. LR7]